MFMKATEALDLLQDCEQRLRRLVAAAAADGDYASVVRITDWAKAIGALAGEAGAERSAPAGGNGTSGTSRQAVVSATSVTHERRAKVGDTYPKFFRRGDELVKVGWSKKERKEYSHRAPRRAVDAVA